MKFKSFSLIPRFSPSAYQSVTVTFSSKDIKLGCSAEAVGCGDCSVGLSGPEEDDDDSERGLTPARDQHTLY